MDSILLYIAAFAWKLRAFLGVFALFAIAAVYAAWLHFAPRGAGEGRLTRALTAAPVAVAAGFMALVFVASVVAGIVRRLDGMPLGIELAAAQLDALGLGDVAAGLDDRFATLVGHGRGVAGAVVQFGRWLRPAAINLRRVSPRRWRARWTRRIMA